jgi:hypothetical protein
MVTTASAQVGWPQGDDETLPGPISSPGRLAPPEARRPLGGALALTDHCCLLRTPR